MSQNVMINLRGRARNFNRLYTQRLKQPTIINTQQIKPEEVKPEEVKPEEVKPEEVKPEESENIKLVVENINENKSETVIETKDNKIENIKHNEKTEFKIEPIVEEINENIDELEDEKIMVENKVNNMSESLMTWYDGSERNVFQSSVIACNPSINKEIFVWQDKSNKANHANKYGNNLTRPVYIGSSSSNVKNGNTSILFNYENKSGLITNFPKYGNNFNNSSCYTLFIVFNYLTIERDTTIWSNSNGEFTITIDGKTKEIKISSPQKELSTLNYNINTNTFVNDKEWILLTIIYDGSKSTNEEKFKLKINSVNKKLIFNGDVSDLIKTNSKLGVGLNNYNNTPNDWFNGHIGEAFLYNKALNAKSCYKLETYLKEKWGL